MVIMPDCEEIMKLAKYYKRIPLCREAYTDVVTPIILLRRIAEKNTRLYLLESIEGDETQGHYSFLGFNLIMRLTCKSGTVDVEDSSGGGHTRRSVKTSKPLDTPRNILKGYKVPVVEGLPPFTGGFVGYFSYSMIQCVESTLKLKQDNGNDYGLMLLGKIITYDHLKQEMSIMVSTKADNVMEQYGRACEELESITRLIQSNAPLTKPVTTDKSEFTCNVSKGGYYWMVKRVKEYIVDRDIFQTIISRQFSSPYEGSLLNAYRALRTTSPSLYMVYTKLDDDEIMSTLLETLVRLKQGRLTTFPMTGSRPRGATPEEDTRLEAELLANEKELAEHNMLVDLGRNDLGRVSKFSTMEVTGCKMIHEYPRIMHVCPQAEGNIRPDCDGCPAVEAVLPAGTLSGTPKIRACEIIGELEQVPQGIYDGALRCLNSTGNMDICIAIRMTAKRSHKVYVQVGGSIVADSVPELEYEESVSKAGAAINAILKAKEVND